MDGRDTGGAVWTGEVVLELRNRRNWSVGDAELSLHRDTVMVRHAGRGLAVLDRDRFRQWLAEPEPDPFAIDDVIWMVQVGITFISAGEGTFRVTPESLANLLAVI